VGRDGVVGLALQWGGIRWWSHARGSSRRWLCGGSQRPCLWAFWRRQTGASATWEIPNLLQASRMGADQTAAWI
jgi:hypothetical protein